MKQISFNGGSENGDEGERWQDRFLDYQQFDLVEVFRLIWRRRRLVVLGSLAGALLGIAASLNVAPRYLAEGNLVVRSDALVAPEMDRAFDSMAVNEAVVTTEEEVLTSEGLLKRVAEQIDIPPDMLPESLSQRIRSWIEQSNLVDHNTLDILIPPEEQSQRATGDRRTRFIADATTLVNSKGSSVILVRAVTRDPQLSAAIVNGIMQLYMYDRSSEESRTARAIESALRERLRQTRQQIEQAEAQLVKTLQQPGAIETSETPGLMQRMTLIGNKLIDAHADLARRQAEYDAATQMHDGKSGTIDANSETIGKLREQLALFKAALAKTQATRRDPDYARAQQAQIQMLQAQITTEVERVIAQRKSDLMAARATVASLEEQASREGKNRQHLSSTMIGVTGKRDAVASLWRISDALEARLIDLAAHPANLNARILSLASAPLVASFPRKALFAISGFLLSCMTTIAVLLISMHMRALRPTMAIQVARMMNVPLLGSVPQVVGSRMLHRRLVRTDKNSTSMSDSIYAIALELDDAVKAKRLRSVTVTSARNGEGKTTVATALARCLAKMPLRVLLIDFDLRHPSVERGLLAAAPNTLEPPRSQQIGKNEALEVRVDIQSGLHIMTPFPVGGCDDPLGYLRSTTLQQTIQLASDSYDLLVFDTPPVMAVPDALSVARLSDVIVLVAELGRIDQTEAAELSRRLEGTHRQLIGVVVTKVDDDMRYYSSYNLP